MLPSATFEPSARDDMIRIPGGTFRMGSDWHYPEEAPSHCVTVDAPTGGVASTVPTTTASEEKAHAKHS